jgi:hypothetical protein
LYIGLNEISHFAFFFSLHDVFLQLLLLNKSEQFCLFKTPSQLHIIQIVYCYFGHLYYFEGNSFKFVQLIKNYMKKMLLAASVALFLASCGGAGNKTAPSTDSLQVEPNSDTSSASALYLGDKITEEGAISITDLKNQMGDKKEMNVKLTGSIEAVCQKKGCWMELTNEGAEPLRVTFKDYAFFMPKDASGKTAIIEGIAKIEETSVADLQEYAKDAGKTKEEIAAIKEPKKELAFEASGVILR